MKRACLFFIGDITRDSRALRFLDALKEQYDTHAIVAGNADFTEERFGCTLHSLNSLCGSSLKKTFFDFRKRAAAVGKQLQPDVSIASDIYSLPPAIASSAKGTVMYDSRELYTSLASLVDRPITQLFWKQFEKRYARKADIIITVNESIAKILRATFPMQRVEVIYNYPMIANTARSDLLRKLFSIPLEKKILLSQGGLQKGRGAFLLIEAMKELDDCVLVFLGSGPLEEEIKALATSSEIGSKVFHRAAVPSNELLAYTASADIGLCLIENLGQSYFLSLPNKLFEYIAAGIPVIGSDFPELSRIINHYDVGLTVLPSDVAQLREVIRTLCTDAQLHERFQFNARKASKELNWEKEREKLMGLMNLS